jgi:hypothetical protein
MQTDIRLESSATIEEDCPITFTIQDECVDLRIGRKSAIELCISRRGMRGFAAAVNAAEQAAAGA